MVLVVVNNVVANGVGVVLLVTIAVLVVLQGNVIRLPLPLLHNLYHLHPSQSPSRVVSFARTTDPVQQVLVAANGTGVALDRNIVEPDAKLGLVLG
jgi:hypothetical protein